MQRLPTGPGGAARRGRREVHRLLQIFPQVEEGRGKALRGLGVHPIVRTGLG